MFDIAWSELLLIAVVALVIIGPKDLPKVLRTLGQWVRRARLMAGEFQRNVDDLLREADLDDVRKAVESVRGSSLTSTVEAMVGGADILNALRIDPDDPAGKAAATEAVDAAEPSPTPEAPVEQVSTPSAESELPPAATEAAPPMEQMPEMPERQPVAVPTDNAAPADSDRQARTEPKP